MNYKLLLEISIGLLRARLKQSVIAGVGVMFGITMFITLISFMNGLNQMLDGLVINRTAHIRLYNEIKPSTNQPINQSKIYKKSINFISSIKPKDKGKEVYNSESVMHALKQDSRVLGIAPKISTPVFYSSGKVDFPGLINGIDIDAEQKLFFLNDYIIKGHPADLGIVNNSIILGKGVAEKLLVDIGDVMYVTTAQGNITALKVVGLIQFGLLEIDNAQSYTSIQTAQKMMGESNNYITDINIKLKDLSQAPALAKEYSKQFELDAIDIQTANAQFETGSSIRSIISYTVGITLLIVAGFGIYNILNMMIYEKMDSIAIMKATGFSGRDVKYIFIFLSLIIGIAGGIFGLLFGYILSSIIDQIPFETASLPTIKTYPIYYNPIYYMIGFIFAIATTYIAGLLPARKASSIDPVEIIRGK
ncbi:FtsX-like permease family protein [uncultured Cytophaga sp.]|uniref:ABC transporter permease n=1 Tax=uncultured Cytophaga sp. TaxID=160238 RepID=UPI0026062BBB|nr:FtsX-like permease family protein [uncultured Cytophaga sp.]